MKPMSVRGGHFRWTLVTLLTTQIVTVNEQTRNANFALWNFHQICDVKVMHY